MNWQNLIKLAREMAASPPSSPIHQARLRLSVSSTYYTVCRALARSNADTLAGASEADRNQPDTPSTWELYYLGGAGLPHRYGASAKPTPRGSSHQAPYAL